MQQPPPLEWQTGRASAPANAMEFTTMELRKREPGPRIQTEMGSARLDGVSQHGCSSTSFSAKLYVRVFGPYAPAGQWRSYPLKWDDQGNASIDIPSQSRRRQKTIESCVEAKLNLVLRDNADWLKSELACWLSWGTNHLNEQPHESLDGMERHCQGALHWTRTYHDAFNGMTAADYSALLEEIRGFRARFRQLLSKRTATIRERPKLRRAA
jgi:hypothetical protein